MAAATVAPDPITTTSLLLLHRTRRHLINHLHHHHNPTSHFTITTNDGGDIKRFSHWHYSQFDDRNFEIHGQTLFYILILLAILLLTLILLYVRWFIRFRRFRQPAPLISSFSFSSSSSSSSSPAAISSSISVPAQRGLDPAVIHSLPIAVYHRSDNSEVGEGADIEMVMDCCICLGAFEDGDRIKDFPKCHHCYHADCIDKWLLSNPSCPLCRISIRVID
ncbi:hypothetical protein Dimus_032863 [Dionaea muscipula]